MNMKNKIKIALAFIGRLVLFYENYFVHSVYNTSAKIFMQHLKFCVNLILLAWFQSFNESWLIGLKLNSSLLYSS